MKSTRQTLLMDAEFDRRLLETPDFAERMLRCREVQRVIDSDRELDSSDTTTVLPMDRTWDDLLPGQAGGPPPTLSLTFRDYRLIRELGRGGMGIVYEAQEVSLGRRVALKVLPPTLLSDPRAVKRFEREARAAGSLRHSHIVSVHAMGVDGQTPYIAMGFIEGVSVDRAIRVIHGRDSQLAKAASKEPGPVDEALRRLRPDNGPQSFARLAAAFADVGDGLQHAHDRGVIHRDLKPSNLILDAQGHILILDFGLARMEGQLKLTASEERLGTPVYMSPEQASPLNLPVDHRADIYSLGATLYEALAGDPPFTGENYQQVLNQVLHEDPRPPRRRDTRIPKDLETITLKCLRKEPQNRYASASAFSHDLRRFAAGEPIEARPQSFWEKLARRAWRAKLRVAAAFLVTLLAVTSALLVANHRSQLRRERDAFTVREIDRLRPLIASVEDPRAAEAIYASVYKTNGITPGLPGAAAIVRGSDISSALKDGLLDWYLLAESVSDSASSLDDLRKTIRDLEHDGPRWELVDWILTGETGARPPLPLDSFLEGQNKLDGADLVLLARVLPETSADNVPKVLERAIQKKPDSFWAYYQLGQWHLRQTPPDLGAGKRYLTAARALRPDASWARVEYAAALMSEGDVMGAIVELEDAVRAYPRDGQAHWILSKAFKMAGDPAAALKHLWKAADAGPEYMTVEGAIELLKLNDIGAATQLLNVLFLGEGQELRPGRGTLFINEDKAAALFSKRAPVEVGPKGEVRSLLMRLANDLYTGGTTQDTRDLLDRAQRLAPDSPFVQHLLGLAALGEGNADLGLAARYFRRAYELDPEYYRGYRTLMVAYAKKDDFESARATLREYLKAKPGSVDGQSQLAEVLIEKQRFDEAFELYKECLVTQPNDIGLQHRIAETLAQKKDFPHAIEAYRALLRVHSRRGKAHLALGKLLKETDRLDEAAQNFQQAILQGEQADRDTMGFILEQGADPQGEAQFRARLQWASEAGSPEAALRELQDIPPGWREDPAALNAFAQAYHGQREWKAAADAYRKLAILRPNHYEPRLRLAVCLREDGDVQGALVELQWIAEEYPKNGEVWLALAATHEKLGQEESVFEALERAFEFDESGTASASLARHYSDAGRVADAVKHLLLIARKNPEDTVSMRLLATTLTEKLGREEAMTRLETLAMESKHVEAFRVFGEAHKKFGTVEQGILTLDRVIAFDPQRVEALYRKGRMLEEVRRFREAVEVFDLARTLFGRAQRLAQGGARALVLAKEPVQALEYLRRDPEEVPPEQSLDIALNIVTEVRSERPAEALAFLEIVYRDLGAVQQLSGNLLATLGDLRAGNKDLRGAVQALESALRLPGLRPESAGSIRAQLEEYWQALLPDLPSYASIDAALRTPEVLLPEGALWRFHRGTKEPSSGLDWTRSSFDDGSWEEGPSGFGYGDDDDATMLDDMIGAYTSVYVRRLFDFPSSGNIKRLILSVRADDAFIAFVNGVEVARVRAEPRETCEVIPFFQEAREQASEPLLVSSVEIPRELLRPRGNCLALQGLNRSLDSTDFTLIPVLLQETDSAASREEALLSSLAMTASDPGTSNRLRYLEGRVFQRSGDHASATDRFLAVVAADGSRPEPFLRLAETLRARSLFHEAAEVLREALDGPTSRDPETWEAWFSVCASELKLSASEFPFAFPRSTSLSWQDGRAGGDISDYGGRVLWALTELRQSRVLRINCGGGTYQSAAGETWGADLFFTSGYHFMEASNGSDIYSGHIDKTEDDLLYQTERYFIAQEGSMPGYRIPLPVGVYRVSLHFAEIVYSEPAVRIFDISLEGRTVWERYEPVAAGFATAQILTLEASVEDGFLDIGLVPRSENPKISAIEVMPVP